MPALKALLDFSGVASAGTWGAFAARASYEDYVAVARTLDVDQVFWRSLFTNDVMSSGTVLVLESRLGSLSTRLSPYFKTVVSWHASASVAAATQRRINDLKIKNVRVVVAGKPADLDLGGERLAAIVFYGIGEDLTEQWGNNAASLLKALVEKIPQWLTDGGIVVIGENNQCTYQRHPVKVAGNGRRNGIVLPGLRRQICRWLSYSDLYVCSSPVTSRHSPPPDFMRHDAFSEGLTLPKSWITAAKNRILNSKPAKMLWPSFLIVASNRPIHTFLQKFLERQEISGPLGWGREDKIAVKRIVAGNSGTSIIIAGPVDYDTANVIIRLPSQPVASQYCRNNAKALRMLAHTSMLGRVPRLICEGTWQGQEYTAESSCSGFEVDYAIRNLGAMVRQGFKLLNILHRQTGRSTRILEEEYQRLVAPFIQGLAVYCAPDIRERLDNLTKKLRFAMVGQTAFLGYTHGDFKLGNILFDRSRKLTAVIDWDGFSENGFQIFDYLTLLVYSIAYESDRNPLRVYLEHLLPWKLPQPYAHLANEALSGLMVDEDSFLSMRIVFWFALLSARFDPLYKYHTVWQHQFLLPVLPVLENILHSDGRHS